MCLFSKFILYVLGVLVGVALLTLLERKILGIIGLRFGPNKVSVIGVLQPVADAGKLSNKQINFISNFYFFFYYLSSIMMLSCSLFIWSCVGSEPVLISFKFSVLIILTVLGFNSLNSIISGWSTFSKYSLMGSVRTLAQLISYEGVLYLCFFFLIISFMSFSVYSFNFFSFSFLFMIVPYCFYIWVPSVLAELNRTPYDFSEGESELVSGFNTEFGSSSFTLIFLSEYTNILFFSLISALLFFSLNTTFMFFFILCYIIWIRSVLPRFRFDKLMYLAWKFFIPFLTLMLILFLIILFS